MTSRDSETDILLVNPRGDQDFKMSDGLGLNIEVRVLSHLPHRPNYVSVLGHGN